MENKWTNECLWLSSFWHHETLDERRETKQMKRGNKERDRDRSGEIEKESAIRMFRKAIQLVF